MFIQINSFNQYFLLFHFKPEETRIIADTSGLCTSKEVAMGLIKDIKKGAFSNYFGINGFFLATITAGASPVTTFKEAILQVIFIKTFEFKNKKLE